MSAVTLDAAAVPFERPRQRPIGWWGMVMLITTEATIFASLLASYFFIRAGSAEWPPAGIEAPKLERIAVFTVVLLASSIPLVVAERAIARDQVRRVRWLLAVSFVMGLAFLIHQGIEYEDLHFGIKDNAYGSLFYVITGLHGLHVLIGLLMSLVVQAKAAVGRITAGRHETLRIFSMYWHFVDVVWIFVFTSLYISPHFG
ncbi:MAG TPA: cytochrome c oxidase subunit 3 [Acidimicrobiales bacterium]|nr:cytochrome c oxidase subunit 3 [Acidimicrobiales bacterium]